MAARGISTDGGPPAWAVESCCLDGRVGLAKQQGKRVAHRLSKWPTDVEMDGISLKRDARHIIPKPICLKVKSFTFYGSHRARNCVIKF